MPDSGVLIAGLAAGQILLLTVVQGFLSARKDRRDAELRRAEKKEEYARQDAVAERVAVTAQKAEEAAQQFLISQSSALKRSDEIAKTAADERKALSDQLVKITEHSEKIHILVNSDMTAALTNQRESTKLLLIALKEVRQISVKSGFTTSAEDQKAISDAEKRIAELNEILAERKAAQESITTEENRKKMLAATEETSIKKVLEIPPQELK